MDNEQKSQEKPVFKLWTQEEREQNRKEMNRQVKAASEIMKKGIYPTRP